KPVRTGPARPSSAGPAVPGRGGRSRTRFSPALEAGRLTGGSPLRAFAARVPITGVVINGAFRSSGAQSVFSVRARMRTVIGVRERPGEGSRPGPTGTYKRGVRSNDARGERHETTNGRPDDTLPVLPVINPDEQEVTEVKKEGEGARHEACTGRGCRGDERGLPDSRRAGQERASGDGDPGRRLGSARPRRRVGAHAGRPADPPRHR